MSLFTLDERNDGFGAQYHSFIYGILLIETNGGKYIHSPVKSMTDGEIYENTELIPRQSCPSFLKMVESLMNIKSNYECIDDSNVNNVTVLKLGDVINSVHSNINLYSNSDSLKNIKSIFRQNKTFFHNLKFNNNKLNVAVHIRRPNTFNVRIEGSNTPDIRYLNVINQIRKKYINSDLLFHVYSQGILSDFNVYVNNDTILHINEDMEKTFIEMVASDILVTSISSFSLVAGMLSDGEVYYMESHIPPFNSSWIKF